MKPNNRKYRINRKYYYVHLECRTTLYESQGIPLHVVKTSEQVHVTDMHPLNFASSLQKHHEENANGEDFIMVKYTVKAWEEIPRSVYNKHKNPLQELKGLE